MKVPVMTSSLVGLVLFHQGEQLLGSPALGLEVIVIRSRCPGVHLHIQSIVSNPKGISLGILRALDCR